MSFFKQNSNAKRLNELTFTIQTVCHSNNNLEITIKSTKVNKVLVLDKNEVNNINSLKIKNLTILNYYTEILLIKKALDWIFSDTEPEYHKYISINILCNSVYCINTLREWMNIWYNNENQEIKTLKYFNNEIISIYDNLKKCKFSIN